MSWSEKSVYFGMVIPTVDRDFGLANETILLYWVDDVDDRS